DLVAFLQLRDVAQHDTTHVILGEVERDADRATGEFDHLVVHDIREAVAEGDTVRDGPHRADVLAGRAGLQAGNLLFNLLQYRAHGWVAGNSGYVIASGSNAQRIELAEDVVFKNMVADLDTQAGDQIRSCHRHRFDL